MAEDVSQPPTTKDAATDVDFANEPARSIGAIFADKKLIRTTVAAGVALVAGLLNQTVGDDVVEQITTIVLFLAILWMPIQAQREKAAQNHKQATVTREAVYAPATVVRIAERAALTGDPVVEPPPAQPPA